MDHGEMSDQEWAEVLAKIEPVREPPTPLERVVERAAKALADAASPSPSKSLRGIRRLRALLESIEFRSVEQARWNKWSWGSIGEVLGMSRQAVHERWSAQTKPERYDPRSDWYLQARKRARRGG